MIKKLVEQKKAEVLYENWQEGAIWSCLDNVMGEIYVDDVESPKSAMAILGCFCYFAGEPSEEIVRFKPEYYSRGFIIMVPMNDDWSMLISSVYGDKAKMVTRYALEKTKDNFNKLELESLVGKLDSEYLFRKIDEELYNYCKINEWANDFIAQYDDFEMYEKIGFGIAIMKGDEMVCAASSYSSFKDGFEIEIATKEEYRHKGLATICGAKYVLECLAKDLYPSWDAQNKWSLNIAEKLGYIFAGEYTAFEVYEY